MLLFQNKSKYKNTANRADYNDDYTLCKARMFISLSSLRRTPNANPTQITHAIF